MYRVFCGLWSFYLIFLLMASACKVVPFNNSSTLNESEFSTRALSPIPKCGTEIGEFNGIKAYSNGPDTDPAHIGIACKERTLYGLPYQCKELVNRYFKSVYNAPILDCHAKGCLDAARNSPQYFLSFDNGSEEMPQPGDALVFKELHTNNGYGHIAIVIKVDADKIYFMQQNTKYRQSDQDGKKGLDVYHPYGSVSLVVDRLNKSKTLGNYLGYFKVLGFYRSVNAPN